MKKLSFCFVSLFLFTTIKAQVNKQDSLVLVDFYNSTNGTSWTNNANWLSKSSLGTWHGITLDSNGRVSNIQLYNNNLSGKLPPSIGNLIALTSMSLHFGSIGDTIPASVGNLVNLSNFDIGSNKLTGSIPSTIGKLSALTELDLSGNQLTGNIPESIGKLSKLIALWLEFNNLSGSIPSSIGDMKNLGNLVLQNNQLSGVIPSTLGTLPKLADLFLNYNQLSGPIPVSLGNLTILEQLYLDHNQFTFDGMELIAQKFPFAKFSPQAHIPLYPSLGGNVQYLEVVVGGTPKNLLFQWYDGTQLVATNYIDSSYQVKVAGKYSVQASDALIPYFVLYSDTLNISSVPIKFISLQAKEINDQVILEWRTINEINVTSFIIQESRDGKNFTKIGTKNAVGSGNNSYDFAIDGAVNDGTYFRLQAIDKDGSEYYSNATQLQSSVNHSGISIFPNPAKDRATIKGSHISQLIIIDNVGKIALEKSLNDSTNPIVELGNIAKGIYTIRIITGDKQLKAEKLIIQ